MIVTEYKAGVNTIEIFGFEGCCDGHNDLKY